MDLHFLSLVHLGPIDDALPGRDGDQRKCSSLTHRE
jgi:hypothetical protein